MPLFNFSHTDNPYLADPDVLLMLEFQKGEKASFEKLMAKYYKPILNLGYRFLGNKEIAEDVAQEVFIRVYKSCSAYKPQAKFQTWVYKIAKNLCLNELRTRKRKIFSLDEMVETEDSAVKRELEDKKAKDPRQELVGEERAGVIREAIDSLPENQRLAVILRRYEDLPYEEIAQTLNCSVKAVKSLLNRAKENLKVKLASFIKE